jgi:TM2 domain-containing membrane protein YozV
MTVEGAKPAEDVNALLMMRYDANKKSVLVAYFFWLLFGFFGGHRFYFGRWITALGILLLTLVSILSFVAVLFFVVIWIPALWLVIDAFLIPRWTRRYNNDLINRLRG